MSETRTAGMLVWVAPEHGYGVRHLATLYANPYLPGEFRAGLSLCGARIAAQVEQDRPRGKACARCAAAGRGGDGA